MGFDKLLARVGGVLGSLLKAPSMLIHITPGAIHVSLTANPVLGLWLRLYSVTGFGALQGAPQFFNGESLECVLKDSVLQRNLGLRICAK